MPEPKSKEGKLLKIIIAKKYKLPWSVEGLCLLLMDLDQGGIISICPECNKISEDYKPCDCGANTIKAEDLMMLADPTMQSVVSVLCK